MGIEVVVAVVALAAQVYFAHKRQTLLEDKFMEIHKIGEWPQAVVAAEAARERLSLGLGEEGEFFS